ncbi:hypothetical protein [Spirillospora sp. NPDC048819]|uniref:hypothetical protein n=1 Tax=Spirillospora sp. NPDC048819 TaxID=3155268 RepID=UPI0033FB9F16
MQVSMVMVKQNGYALTFVEYHQFLLQAHLDPPQSWDVTNALVTPCPRAGATVHTGIAGGYVAVATEAHDQAPPVQADVWEEVAEVTVQVPESDLVVATLDGDGPDLPPLNTAGPGPCRVRVHARGRDTAIDAVMTEPVEHYLLQCWPAPAAPEAIHKQTDNYGAELREAAEETGQRASSRKPDHGSGSGTDP